MLYIYIFICSIYLFSLFIYLFIYRSIDLSIYPTIYLSIYLSIYLYSYFSVQDPLSSRHTAWLMTLCNMFIYFPLYHQPIGFSAFHHCDNSIQFPIVHGWRQFPIYIYTWIYVYMNLIYILLYMIWYEMIVYHNISYSILVHYSLWVQSISNWFVFYHIIFYHILSYFIIFYHMLSYFIILLYHFYCKSYFTIFIMIHIIMCIYIYTYACIYMYICIYIYNTLNNPPIWALPPSRVPALRLNGWVPALRPPGLGSAISGAPRRIPPKKWLVYDGKSYENPMNIWTLYMENPYDNMHDWKNDS